MSHLLRPPSESAFPVADALMGVPRCILVLETAVRDVLTPFWDERRRRIAHRVAQTMSGGCKVCGFKESSGILRSMESLLSLSAEDARAIQSSLGERLSELIGMLREHAQKMSKGEPAVQTDR